MKIKYLIVIAIFVACEVPEAPNFTLSQKFQAPLITDYTIQVMGDANINNVLIDTTSDDLDSLFTVVQSGDDIGFISINKNEEFEFGDLNDAIPEIDTDKTEFNAEVGEISIGDFSSGTGNLGEANFQDLTGINPSTIPAGIPIPGGSSPTPTNIDVGNNTDFFKSATIKRGSIQLTLTNDLGFTINELNIVLNSGENFVNEASIKNFNTNTSRNATIAFSAGDKLENINVDVSVAWNAQVLTGEINSLIVNGIEGIDLVASEVEAALEPQDFSTSNTTDIETDEFQFTNSEHYVELESGIIDIDPIVSDLDLTVEELIITFNSIRKAPFTESDGLVISYVGEDKIERKSSAPAKSIDLAGYRLYATNNQVSYSIRAITENTKSLPLNDRFRTVNELHSVSSGVSITNIKVAEAYGVVKSKTVLLGEDDSANGTEIIDLFNETEAEIIEISGLEDLSSKLENLEFTQAKLSINYTSNIGISTSIYASIMGIDGDDNEFYLTGSEGSTNLVSESDNISGLQKNGINLTSSELVKFEISPSITGELIDGSIEFNQNNSTVIDFLNNLPKEIRFIGKAVINEDGGEALISTPLEFTPSFEVELPLALKTSNTATYTDTLESNALKDLPSEDDPIGINGGQLIINYKNSIPLGFGIELTFLDESKDRLTDVPLLNDDPIDVLASVVDDVTRYSSEPNINSTTISLTKDQFDLFNQTKFIVFTAKLNTYDNSEIKLRSLDSLTVDISASLELENVIGDN